MANVHDLGYSVLFSNKTIFKQLLETFVKEPWVCEIDFEHIEKLNKSFVSKKHRKHESDLIYKVKLKNQTAYIIILIEFQSNVQHFMAVRVLHYMMSFYLDLIKQKSLNKLPPVFPIVLYNGDAKWTAPTDIQELIENHTILGDFGVQFKYFNIAENEFTPENLLKIKNIVSTLFLAENHTDIEVLAEELRQLFRKEDQEAILVFFNWFEYLRTESRLSEKDFEKLATVYRNEGDVNMLLTAVRKERQEFFNKGKFEGKLEGKLEGKFEEKKGIAQTMLSKNLDVVFISEITGLSYEEITQLKQKDTNK